MKYFHIVIFIWAMFGSIHSNAQNTTKDTTLRLVERYDGVKYIAKILSDDGRELSVSYTHLTLPTTLTV